MKKLTGIILSLILCINTASSLIYSSNYENTSSITYEDEQYLYNFNTDTGDVTDIRGYTPAMPVLMHTENTPSVNTQKDREYSEVVYIYTTEELLSIDGRENGYYELKNDLDISGSEWIPLNLNNATLNGAGHTISGMTVTKELVGFISGYENYVYDLTLDNVSVRVTNKNPSNYYNSLEYTMLGDAYATDCSFNGDIEITHNHTAYLLYVYGISGGLNNTFNGNITVNGLCHAYGIKYGTDCTLNGNITANGTSTIYGITDSNNCTFNGNITGDGSCGADSITNCIDCTFNGNIRFKSKDSSVRSVLSGSKNCAFTGDIEADKIGCLIANSDSCTFSGNTKQTSENFGQGAVISNSINSNVITDTCHGGIDNSTNCHIKGNVNLNTISSSHVSSHDIYGTRLLPRYSNAQIYTAITKSTNCSISGTISAKIAIYNNERTLKISASSPKALVYISNVCNGIYTANGIEPESLPDMCDNCSDDIRSNCEISRIWFMRYSDNNSADSPPASPTSKLTAISTTVGLYEDKDCTESKKVSSLTASFGSFSWNKADAQASSEPERTNFDTLYLKITAKSTDTANNVSNVIVTLTAPEGFSFAEYEQVEERRVYLGELNYSAEIFKAVPVYPIYSENYDDGDKLSFKVQASSGIAETSVEDKTVATIVKNKDEGKIPFRPTKNVTKFSLGKAPVQEVSWKKDYFEKTSYTYNHSLSKLSAALSASVYRYDDIVTALKNSGFSTIESINYSYRDTPEDQYTTNPNSVAAVFAKKKILTEENGEEKIFSIIATIVRGTIENEWYGNFDIFDINDGISVIAEGNEDIRNEHASFSNSKQNVLNSLKKYLENHVKTEESNLKFLITGHSRGAATANLVAAKLDRSGSEEERENIYCYTFASPNGTRDSGYSSPIYNNIYNIVNDEDFVTYVAFDKWGFNKYGKILALPTDKYDKNYQQYFSRMMTSFNRLTNNRNVFYQYELCYRHIVALAKYVTDNVNIDEYYTKELGFNDKTTYTLYEYFHDIVARATLEDRYAKVSILMNSTEAGRKERELPLISKYFVKNGTTCIAYNHSMEAYMAWLDAISGVGDYTVHNKSTIGIDVYKTLLSASKKITIKGNVDVKVYNSKNEPAGEVIDNIINENISGNAEVYIFGDSKVIYLPDDEIFTFEIIGNDTGTMDYSITEYDKNNEKSRVVNFYDLPVIKEKTTTCTVDNVIGTSTDNYALKLHDNTVISASEDISGDELDNLAISVNITGNGQYIGDIHYTKGELATLLATEDRNIFKGWYDADGTLLCENELLSFTVTENQTIEARFENLANLFVDISENEWYYDFVVSAYNKGLIKGVTATEFAPNENVTRGMFVTILHRMENEPNAGANKFADVSDDMYYAKAIAWAVDSGIVTGTSEICFEPDMNISREQMATIIYRFAKYKGYDIDIGKNTDINSFNDHISISDYATEPVRYAIACGLIKGKTESTINPSDNATRAETAAILHRFIEANK